MIAAATPRFRTMIAWEASSGKELFRWSFADASYGGVAFSPDSRLMASAASDGSLLLWDLAHARARLGS